MKLFNIVSAGVVLLSTVAAVVAIIITCDSSQKCDSSSIING